MNHGDDFPHKFDRFFRSSGLLLLTNHLQNEQIMGTIPFTNLITFLLVSWREALRTIQSVYVESGNLINLVQSSWPGGQRQRRIKWLWSGANAVCRWMITNATTLNDGPPTARWTLMRPLFPNSHVACTWGGLGAREVRKAQCMKRRHGVFYTCSRIDM